VCARMHVTESFELLGRHANVAFGLHCIGLSALSISAWHVSACTFRTIAYSRHPPSPARRARCTARTRARGGAAVLQMRGAAGDNTCTWRAASSRRSCASLAAFAACSSGVGTTPPCPKHAQRERARAERRPQGRPPHRTHGPPRCAADLLDEALAQNLEGSERGVRLPGHGVAVPRRLARDDALLVEDLAAHRCGRAPAAASWRECLSPVLTSATLISCQAHRLCAVACVLSPVVESLIKHLGTPCS
jgi:hypothetical protein